MSARQSDVPSTFRIFARTQSTASVLAKTRWHARDTKERPPGPFGAPGVVQVALSSGRSAARLGGSAGYTASTTVAMPWPPAMQSVAKP